MEDDRSALDIAPTRLVDSVSCVPPAASLFHTYLHFNQFKTQKKAFLVVLQLQIYSPYFRLINLPDLGSVSNVP